MESHPPTLARHMAIHLTFMRVVGNPADCGDVLSTGTKECE